MKNYLFAILFAVSTLVNAQVDELPYIEVDGQAERFVTPDEIYLQVVISADKASEFNSLKNKTMSALKGVGLSSDNITLADAQGNEVSAWFKDDFETKAIWLVKVKTAQEVSKVMAALRDLGVKQVAIAKIDYSKKEDLMNELRVEAMKDAKNKSTLMLTAVDAKLGKPIMVRENSWGTRPVYENCMINSKTLGMGDFGEDVAEPDSFKKLKYRSEVSVRFAIAE